MSVCTHTEHVQAASAKKALMIHAAQFPLPSVEHDSVLAEAMESEVSLSMDSVSLGSGVCPSVSCMSSRWRAERVDCACPEKTEGGAAGGEK